MENPTYRERVLLGYDIVSGSVGVTCLATPKTPYRHSEVDFADVFGGPPRASMEEDGQSCRETVILSRNKDELPAHSNPWAALGQRSVFGEESPSRRHLAKDFYDDIFKMDDPLGSRRRYSDVTHYSPSISASRGLSPVHPSTPNTHEPSSVAKPTLIRQLSFSRIGRRSESLASTPPHISPKRSKLTAGGSQRSKDEGSPTKVKDSSSSHFSLYKWAAKGMPFPSAFKGRNGKESKNDAASESAVDGAKVLAHDKLESIGSVSFKDLHSKQEEMPFKSSVDMLHDLLRKDVDDDQAEISFLNGHDTRDKMSHDHTIDTGKLEGTQEVLDQKSANSQSWKAESAVSDDTKVHKKILGKENVYKCGNATKLPQEAPIIKDDVGKRETGKVLEFVKKFSNEEQLKSFQSKDHPNALKQKKHPSHQTKLEEGRNNKSVEHINDNLKVHQMEHPEPLLFADEGSVTENFGTPFHCIEVESIIEDYQEQTPMSQELENIQVLDAKIRKWSNGKEANLRALLSTLQYVLWPESGWKAVPLVDIIESTSVKRAYQKTMLYLHPDKLQQKGASSEKKYTAAKVFDILQEAWNHFNTLSAL